MAAAVAQAIMIDSTSHIFVYVHVHVYGCMHACVRVCIQCVRSRSVLSILFRFVIRACVEFNKLKWNETWTFDIFINHTDEKGFHEIKLFSYMRRPLSL